jgi:serine/threonine-protein kinase HipA
VADAVRRWREFASLAGMTDENLISQIEQTHRLYLAEQL